MRYNVINSCYTQCSSTKFVIGQMLLEIVIIRLVLLLYSY